MSHPRDAGSLLDLRQVSRALQRAASALSKSEGHVGESHLGPNPQAPPSLLPLLLALRTTVGSEKDTLYLIG